ncbi:YwmB family TATA-box binding protein [Paenibacillus sp. p3-SID867]|uniref:YwmB family TATA-box binding protein n=1 Tax=Paenibacillus sp. p3-SID867 TaxID=2916363 RepID=UPI0021A424E2|nr:YwmB family TATA-box binding protein [Paenibacillus sp. p3-SID867]MCT1401619.1 YwmB family TATA-box binding protein [Paenibacillus sp. p3-SID867]
MRKMRLQIIVMMLLLCGAAGMMAGFAGTADSNRNESAPYAGEASASALRGTEESSVNGITRAGEAAESDLTLLAALGQEHMEPSAILTVKIQGEMINSIPKDQAKTTAEQLARTMGLSGITTSQLQGNEVFQAEGVLSGVSVHLDWAFTTEGHSYVRAMLVGDAAGQSRDMMTLQQQIQEMMKQAGIPNSWNASIQGYASETASVDGTMAQVEGAVAQKLSLRPVEDYADDTTQSRSYEVPSLGAFVMSGDTPIHMQIAVHEDSMKKSSRITIGFPVITIEY